jgi:hypothetical protein
MLQKKCTRAARETEGKEKRFTKRKQKDYEKQRK